MPRKKIVFIVKYFYPVKRPSGISSFIYELAEVLAKSVDLSVISFRREKDNKKEYQHHGFTIYKVKKPFFLTAAFLTNKIKPDLVIIFSGIYEPFKTMLYFGLVSFLLVKKKQIFCQATNYYKKILPKLYAHFLRHFWVVIATNEFMQEQYKNLGVSSKLITPGVKISAPTLNKVAKNKEVRIGFFGHFYQIKGPDRLLNAFLKIDPQNAEVIFAGGDGPLKIKIEEMSEKDSRISLIDWQENITPYVTSCDIVVLPYRSSQSVLGFSRVALEAMYLHIPIIGTKTPSLEFLIKDGYNGYIVNDDADLEEKLRYLIENLAKRRELGENAYQTILNNFNIEKIATKYLNLIYGD